MFTNNGTDDNESLAKYRLNYSNFCEVMCPRHGLYVVLIPTYYVGRKKKVKK